MQKVDCTQGHNFLQVAQGSDPHHAYLCCSRCGTVLSLDMEEDTIAVLDPLEGDSAKPIGAK
jgi:Fe2+ or Zn2+ uptake regulation protein